MSDDPSSEFRLANGQFAKGNPGGPGRPHAADRARELDRRAAEAGPELIDALLETAKGGNLRAMEMLLDRIYRDFRRFFDRFSRFGDVAGREKARCSGVLAGIALQHR